MGVLVTVAARRQPLSFDPRRTAVIVLDMQNDFGTDGGMFDRAGVPMDGIKALIAPIAEVLRQARAAAMTIVYLKMQFERTCRTRAHPTDPTCCAINGSASANRSLRPTASRDES